MVAKSLATLGVVRYVVKEEDALVAFGVGQVVYSGTIFVGLWWVTRGHRSAAPPSAPSTINHMDTASFLPLPLKRIDNRFFDPAVTTLGWALTKQSMVKQLLTEGDKLAVGKFGSSEDMGAYGVALNYGAVSSLLHFLRLFVSSSFA
jgi:oligosaccharide translocation protein RFT1